MLMHEQVRATVLIVDDQPDSLSFLCDALDAGGFTVLVATDGVSALERLQIIMPDAVLLDASMPGMDGFEVCRRIKADQKTAALPVIFMTGLSETAHIVEGFRAGGIDYVTKPVHPDELIARLATHARNARTIRQARVALDVAGERNATLLTSLTARETEVLYWLSLGKTNRDIGAILEMSPRTVNKHLEHIYEKLGVETRVAAAAKAPRELIHASSMVQHKDMESLSD